MNRICKKCNWQGTNFDCQIENHGEHWVKYLCPKCMNPTIDTEIEVMPGHQHIGNNILTGPFR